MRHQDPESHCEYPSPYKSFDSLVRADLDERRPSEGDTAEICPDIIRDDQRRWKKEPYHSFKDIVHDEMGLNHD